MLINTQRASRPLATFNGNSSYRLDGDIAHLMADVQLEPQAHTAAEWALQLWACEAGSNSARIKLAEMPLQSPAYEALTVEGWTALQLPASQQAHTLSLAIASGQAGVFSEIHDLVNFPQPERFVQPCLEGELSVREDGAQIKLQVPAVRNPRSADTLSGSLSVEIWALSTEYAGGEFEGTHFGGVLLGQLAGQDSVSALELVADRADIAQGSVLTVMLREWTANGHVTRDFRQIALAPMASKTEVAPLVAGKPAVKKAAAEKAPKAAAKKVEETVAAAQKPAAADARISINDASEADLAAVKGLSQSAAAGIVAGRPYKTLDEVVRAKGMGEKLLAKLRDLLRV